MAITITKVSINNKEVGGSVITVPLDIISINWEIATTTPAIKQLSYEIRIAKHAINWGSSSFASDVVRQPYARDRSQYWRFKPKFVQRGEIFYGQIRVKDTTGEESDWVKFSFNINRLPFLTSAKITPEEPSEGNDLELELGNTTEVSLIKTRWFRNGIHYSQFDNYQKISTEYIRFGDTWYAEATPDDGMEQGPTVFATAITVSKKPPVVDSLQILPINPNVNDILEANYVVNDSVSGTLLLKDKSLIRWYINGSVISEADDQRFVRLAFKPNDEVYFTVTPSDGIFHGDVVASNSVIIQDAGFRTINLRVDGLVENLGVNSVNPTIEWDVIQPFDRSSRFASLKLGTAPGASNVYSTVIETYDFKFTIPDNLVRRGLDYYISVASSDANDLFEHYETSRFRVAGNLWERDVSNETGWTIELAVSVTGEDGYQRVSLGDGQRFAEVRFYTNKAQLLLGASSVLSFDLDITKPRNIIIVGKQNTIKVYAENSLILDGSDLFIEFSSDRFIEIGSSAGSEVTGFFKRIAYNVDGYYEPGSSVYSSIHLERFIDFTGSAISDITEHEGNVLVASNPLNEADSGETYKIIETEKPVLASTESVDVFDLKVNGLTLSPDESVLYIAHSKGASYFDSYFIPKYDSDSTFIAGFDPKINYWELVKTTPFSAISYVQEGLVIDTTISNRTTLLSSESALVTANVQALSFLSLYDSIFSYSFDVQITESDELKIFLAGTSTEVYSTSLIGKTIDELVTELKSLTSSVNYFFSLFYDIVALNGVGSQVASRLTTIAQTGLFPEYNLYGDYQVVDTYNPSPYGTLSTGKWFYAHRKKGTPWFDRADNEKGWTIDFDFRVDEVEDSDTPSAIGKPKGVGLYINDGLCSENLWFLPQEVVFEGTDQSFVYDTTSMTKYRLMGKKTKLKLFGKKSTDQSYQLIAETTTRTAGTNQGNAGRPSVFTDRFDVMHAVWHDDGLGLSRRQIYYNKFTSSSGWGEPELIVSDAFSSSNPCIAVDSAGGIYVVYETTRGDYTDISVVYGNGTSWSDPFLLTSNLYDSFAPKVAIDVKDNVHVVWEDYRNGHPQIFYCRRSASNGQWESAVFGGTDIQITADPVGAKRPALIANNTKLYVSWTSFNRNGSSSIKMAAYDDGAKNWISSGQGGNDFSVSGLFFSKADNSDIIVDLKGQIAVVWNDVVDYNYQLFGRFINSRLVFAKPVTQLTSGDFDSTHPRCGLNTGTGDIYVVFEKQQEKIASPYDPYSARESDVSFKSPGVYAIKWDAYNQKWISSNQFPPAGYTTSFDVEFDFGLPRQCYRPTISRKFSSYLHILFESSEVSPANENIPNRDLFTQARVIDFSSKTMVPMFDVTADLDLRLDGALNRKELRFGDFSDNLSTRLVVGSLKYYLSDAVNPFKIGLVSSATTNIPNKPVLSTATNNRGDAWLGTEDGLIFYNKTTKKAYVVDSDSSNVKELTINGISFDKKSNMYLATSQGVYASADHSYFFKLNFGATEANAIEVDNLDNLFVCTNNGLYVVDLVNTYNKIFVTKENVNQVNRSIDVVADEVQHFTIENGLPSNTLNVVRTDAGDVAWIGSDKGLIRYDSNGVSVFTTANGLNSNRINDIAIRNTAIRYIATTAGVNKMVGISVLPLNFDNTNSPPASINQIGVGDVNIPIFVNARSVVWKDPNILWIASTYNVFQITFIEESFTTEKTETTKFSSQDFTLSPITHSKNDDLQTFRIVGIDDREIPSNAVFEVSLNGNKLTRGYSFSPEKKLIRFSYPLFETDIININVRFDVEKFGDFRQNKAQQIAIGNKATRLEKLISSGGSVYAMTGGDVNTVQINDQTTDLPFDRIILDRTPPAGKITLGTRRDRTVFEVNVAPLESDSEGVFDATSGIDKMVVSNFTNFTSDGETPLEPIVFTRFLLHNIGDILDSVSRQFTFTSGSGNRLLNYHPVGGDPVIMAGTSSPANIYKYNGITQAWDKIDTLDTVGGIPNPSASVEFLIEYQGKVYAGTGSPNGSGKVWVLNTGTMKFELLRTLPSNTHAYCAVVFDEVLYIGGGGGSYGALYSFDGTSTTEVFRNVSGAIYSLVESDRELYAATGYEGRIYKLDTKNNTQQIVDVNADRNVTSIGKATVNGQGYIFAGFGSSGQVKRSKVPSSPFVHSFKTVPSAVYSMRNIGGVLYAAIGNTLYYLDNVWTAKYTHRETIKDVVEGEDGLIWFVSDSYIYKIGRVENVKKVYLKLIDRAGNETKLFTDASQTELDANLFDEISISDLAAFTNRNRILKVDEVGNTTSLREGNDRFYSGDLVEEETGEYYSEFFNGTNNLVSWDKISWDATVPDNTSVTIYVRTGATKDEILDKEFTFSVDAKEQNADISFLSGQFIQFRIVMKSRVRGLSPSLRNVVIRSISSDSTHFFTTNFALPSRIKSGIVTSTKILPVAADIVFGINTNNSTDFAEYQIVDENRIFTTEDGQIGNGMRVGIRFITPTRAEASGEIPGEYSPYGSALFFNAVEWSFANSDASERAYNFNVSFYEDPEMTTLVYSASSSVSHIGFSSNGDIFSTGGEVFGPGQTKEFSFTPIGTTTLKCSTYYYVKIEAVSELGTTTVSEDHAFIESCGTTYVDTISFDFMNTTPNIETLHFRVRFYNNPERTDLKYTAFSGNDLTNWLVNEADIPVEGFTTNPGETISVNYTPSTSNVDANKTYYLSIDVYNGETFENNSNSFTFKANDLASQVYCGSYSDVPIVKNFSIMFELENNEFVSMRVNV